MLLVLVTMRHVSPISTYISVAVFISVVIIGQIISTAVVRQ